VANRPSVVLLLAEIAVAVAARMAQERAPPAPPDTNMARKAAWIGFAGSVGGACIAGLIAVVALYPALKQTEAAQRATAVSAGQILRARFKAANDEVQILAKGGRLEQVSVLLALGPEDTGRSVWLTRHPDRAALIKSNFIPFLDALLGELFEANASVELPDLERGTYVAAVVKFRDLLYTTLDGLIRENGSIGREMKDDEWRAHVGAAATFAWKDWSRARLIYNNRINTAQIILRAQIIETDRLAMGQEAAPLFQHHQQTKIPIDDDWPPPIANTARSKL